MSSTSQGMMLSDDGITLEDQMLIEDDAPACGYSSKEGSVEILKEGVVLKKIIHLDEMPVEPVRIAMLVYPENPPQPNNGRHLLFAVNGHEITYPVNHFWTDVPVPVAFLQLGDNIITVRSLEPDTRFRTWIALDENFRIGAMDRPSHPNRSARSKDRGQTWDFEHLGEKGAVDGEYSIRLKVANYHPSGWLESPVLDMASNSDFQGLKQSVIVKKASINLQKLVPENTQVELRARTGATHYVSQDSWSDWMVCTDQSIPRSLLKNRFMQYRVIFKRQVASASPLLKQVTLVTQYQVKDANLVRDIKVIEAVNRPKRSSSFAFQYENPRHPKLVELSNKYHLDQVIAGCETEFEKMLKLKSWVAQQWRWHLLQPDEDIIEWDALKILSPGENGKTSGGYCLHYAIVYLQVLQSFGFHARIVNTNYSIWSGHEVVEVWSNEFGKWIFLDPNFDTHFVDSQTAIPLNVLELHDLFLALYYPHEPLDRDNWSRADFIRRSEAVGKPASVECMVGGGANAGTLKHYEWWKPVLELYPYCGGFGFLNAGFIMYMPRNDFFSQPLPIPLNHGRTHWGWTGYYCWFDEQTPRTQEHSQFTNRKNDLYWNLNEVDFSAEIVEKDKLSFHFTTNSPAFSHYRLLVNGEDLTRKEGQFTMNLIPGRNQLRVKTVDGMHHAGRESLLDVMYTP